MDNTQTRRAFLRNAAYTFGGAALAGCGSTAARSDAPKTEAKALSFEDLTAIRTSYIETTKGGEVSPRGLMGVIQNYERMAKNGIAKDAGEEVKALYNTLKNEHQKLIEGAYGNADLFLYVGQKSDMSDRGHKDVPIGNGASHAFSLDDKVALLRKSTEKAPEFKADKHNVIPYQQVLGKGVFVEKSYVDALVKGKEYGDKYLPPSYLNEKIWKNLTDGKAGNGELRGEPAHLVVHAVYTGHKIK